MSKIFIGKNLTPGRHSVKGSEIFHLVRIDSSYPLDMLDNQPENVFLA
jgi:hypothetical protein